MYRIIQKWKGYKCMHIAFLFPCAGLCVGAVMSGMTWDVVRWKSDKRTEKKWGDAKIQKEAEMWAQTMDICGVRKKELGIEAKMSYLGNQVRCWELHPRKRSLELFNYEDWHLLPRATFNEPGVWGVCASFGSITVRCCPTPTRRSRISKTWDHCSVRTSYSHTNVSHFLFTQEHQFLLFRVHFILKV